MHMRINGYACVSDERNEDKIAIIFYRDQLACKLRDHHESLEQLYT